jgi:hypothetical protein
MSLKCKASNVLFIVLNIMLYSNVFHIFTWWSNKYSIRKEKTSSPALFFSHMILLSASSSYSHASTLTEMTDTLENIHRLKPKNLMCLRHVVPPSSGIDLA